MSRVPPPVGDQDALERLVRTYAREKLRDPGATLYGHRGHTQDGLDVIAHDPEGRLWGFQCKATREFKPADVDKEVARLMAGPLRPDHYLIVTTAEVSPAVHQRAEAASVRTGMSVRVWEWSSFEHVLIDHVGVGPWLSTEERARLRADVATRIGEDWAVAQPLHPLRLPGVRMPKLRDVLVAPRVSEVAGEPSPTPETIEALVVRSKGLLLVSGPAGAGKTIALLEAQARFADLLTARPTALVPALLAAVDLANDDWPALLSAEARKLWEDPESEWVVFCDGLDQVPGGRPTRRVETRLKELAASPRVRAVLATCRSNVSPAVLPEARRFRMVPWSPTDVAALRSHWSVPGTTGTRSPLEATLDVVTDLPGRGRLGQLDAVVGLILGEWAREHEWQPEAAARLRAQIELLAWEAKRVGQSGIADADLRRALLQAGNAHEVVDAAAMKLGLLERAPGGLWTFALPLTGEALGAAHLARRGPDAVRDAIARGPSAAMGALAFVRLALLPGGVEGAVDAVFRGIGAGSVAEDLQRLRAVVEAGREVGLPPGTFRQALSDRLVQLATDETRAWVRRAAQSMVHDLLVRGIDWASDLELRLVATLTRSGDRVAWVEHSEPSGAGAEQWLDTLREEDPATRALAIRCLAAHIDRLDVREALLWAVADPSFDLTLDANQPAVEAGIILSGVVRDIWWKDQARPFLIYVLRAGGQFAAAGAAFALGLDDDVDGDRATALRGLASWPSEPVYVAISALRGRHGEAWLTQRWPEAPTQATRRAAWPRRVSLEAPASRAVQAELKVALASTLARADIFSGLPDEVRHDPMVLHAIAEGHAGRGEPVDVLMAAIKATPDRFVPPSAQAVLGHAALDRPDVAKALFDLWDQRAERMGLPSSYPGVALDGLAARGDAEASRRYAEWLPYSPFIQLFTPWWPPTPAALRQPDVRIAALDLSRDLLGRATGRAASGRLAVEVLGAALRALREAWSSDCVIADELMDRALGPSDDERWFEAALCAYDDAPPPQLIDRLIGKVRGWRGETYDPSTLAYHLPLWLDAVHRSGLGASVEEPLLDVVREASPAAYRAAAMLCGWRADAREHVSRVLRRWPLDWHPGFPRGLDDRDVRALVGAAPDLWAARMDTALSDYGWIVAEQVVDMTAILLEFGDALDAVYHQALIGLLRDLSSHDRLWVAGSRPGAPARRLSDMANTVLLQIAAW